VSIATGRILNMGLAPSCDRLGQPVGCLPGISEI
jgi:hypothetical protein